MLLCLMLCASGTAVAQEVSGGFKAGVNFANVTFDAEGADISFDRRTGFVGGLFVIWPANTRAALQIEALYSQKGAKMEEGGGSGEVELDYLEVPVLVRLSSDRSMPTSFNVFAGPSVGFRLRARAKSEFDGESEDEDISDDIERLDFGLAVGAGLELGRFIVDGRYTWGLVNINKEDADEVKVKNRVFSVMAGIRF
jgi:opacity protein-like surface antigen